MTEEQGQPKTPEKRAIVMLSIGERDWLAASAGTFERYARRCGADFRVEARVPDKAEFPLAELPDKPGRPGKAIYACKIYFAWKYLERLGYDRVLVVDDSCCVRAAAPDLFALAPRGGCGFTGTSADHARLSFETIGGFLEARGLEPVAFEPADYMNGGVILYDRAMADAIGPDRICAAAELLYARYPQQTLLYYLLKRGGVALHRLPKAFNSVPASKVPRPGRFHIDDIRPHLTDRIFIYHLTAGYRHRAALIKQLGALFLQDWDRA